MDHPSFSIRHEIKPGDIGMIIYLHGVLYEREYGFDHTFEPYVAGPISAFVLNHTDRERLWIVEKTGTVKGSIAIVKHTEEEAQLRWLILHPDLRGLGIGKELVKKAVGFCRDKDYKNIFLWTVSELAAAVQLYRSEGFRLSDSKTHLIWGRDITEERYDLGL